MRDASLADATFKDLSRTDVIYLLASVNVSPMSRAAGVIDVGLDTGTLALVKDAKSVNVIQWEHTTRTATTKLASVDVSLELGARPVTSA